MEQLPDVAQLPLHFHDPIQRRYELIRPVLLDECTATERAAQTHHHPDTIGKLKRIFPAHFGERRTLSEGYLHSCPLL